MPEDLISFLDAGMNSDHPSVIIDAEGIFPEDMFGYAQSRTRTRWSRLLNEDPKGRLKTYFRRTIRSEQPRSEGASIVTSASGTSGTSSVAISSLPASNRAVAPPPPEESIDRGEFLCGFCVNRDS